MGIYTRFIEVDSPTLLYRKHSKRQDLRLDLEGGSGYDLYLVAFKQKKSEEEIIKIASPFLSPFLLS